MGENLQTGPILIRGARQLLTLRGPKGPRRGPELNELGIISDGALLIRDGLIQEVGPSRRVENLAVARGAVEVDALTRVVMPGFVDSHTHLVFPPYSSRGEDPEAALRTLHSSSNRVLAARLRWYLDAMVRHGTTTLEVKTGCAADESAEVKALHVLESLRQETVDVNPAFHLVLPPGASDQEAERIVSDLPPRIYRRGLSLFADLGWEDRPALYESFGRFLECATAHGLATRIHAEGPGAAVAAALAVGHRANSVDHLEHLTAAQAALLGNVRTIATLLPSVPLRNGGPLPPARALIRAGAAVALATNFNPARSPLLSMQTIVALACTQLGFEPGEAISAATINGAHALGRADRIGSLEPGKCADVLLLNIDDYHDLAHTLGQNLVHLTFKQGRCVYREGAVGH